MAEEYEYPPTDSDGDYSDEEEDGFGELPEMNKQNEPPKVYVRRKTVMATKVTMDENWVPPVHEKSSEVEETIRGCMSDQFLFNSLDTKDLDILLR